MSVGGPSVTNIDPRLWAYLRILYAKKEEDLTKHGYTPFTLQNAGSMLSADIEAEVIKTLVGISGVILRIYGSSMKVCGTVWYGVIWSCCLFCQQYQFLQSASVLSSKHIFLHIY
jgi:hypothetical protein